MNICSSPWAKVVALWWSSSSLPAISRRDSFPAAASIPACRNPPPRALRHRTALDMKSRGPASRVPTGAPKPCTQSNQPSYCNSTCYKVSLTCISCSDDPFCVCFAVRPWRGTHWRCVCAAVWWLGEPPGPQQRSSAWLHPCAPPGHICLLKLEPWRWKQPWESCWILHPVVIRQKSQLYKKNKKNPTHLLQEAQR